MPQNGNNVISIVWSKIEHDLIVDNWDQSWNLLETIRQENMMEINHKK